MAEFRISQGLDVGVSGRSRVDLVPGTVITLEVTEPVGPGVTYTWRIIDAVNSVAVLTSTTAETTDIGSSGAQIVELCGFLIELEANDGGTITTDRRVACVPHAATGIRTPLFGESAPRTQTLALNDPDLSTDNALYSNLGGRGVSGQNPFGWREWAWRVVKAIAEVQESGGSASVQIVTTATAVIAPETRYVFVLYDVGPVELTAPPAVSEAVFGVRKCNSNPAADITVVPVGADTMSGAASLTIPGSETFFTISTEFFCAADGTWESDYGGIGVLSYIELINVAGEVGDLTDSMAVVETTRGATVVWSPGSPDAGVYTTAGGAFNAIADIEGDVTVLLDPLHGTSFAIPSGTYQLKCRSLEIRGIGRPGVGQPTVVFSDGITWPAPPRILEFTTVNVRWEGTAPLITGIQGLSLNGPVDMRSWPGSAAPMIVYNLAAGLVFNGPLCTLDADGEYELIEATTGVAIYTFMTGFQGQLAANTIRGDGQVLVLHNSTDGNYASTTQTNLIGGLGLLDVAANVVALEAGVTDLDDRVIVLEEAGAFQESIGGTGSLWLGDSGDSDEISGRDLTAVTTARYGVDRNKSYQFYFAGGQGFSQNDADLRETGDLTVEVVLQGGPANAVQWVVSHDTSPARRYYLGFDATGQIIWGFDNGATAFQITGYPRNPWERTHVVARRTIVGPDTYLSLWVNGRVNLEDVIASQVPTGGGANNTLYFGQNSANAERLGSAASPVLVSQLYIDPGVVWTNTQVTDRARALGIYLP